MTPVYKESTPTGESTVLFGTTVLTTTVFTMTTVFVSGATGYIAQHIIKLLIAENYKVVGSVRSAAKGDKLKANLKSANFTYEIVPDILTAGAFDEALKAHQEVSVFLHTASPFDFSATDIEKEQLIPAIEGTKNALYAIKKYGPNVTRVVLTSSYAAVGTASLEFDQSTVVTEDTWNDITREEALVNSVSGYRASKTFAERAAWDFVKNEKPNFALTAVNPAFVFGPQAFDSEVTDRLHTSAELVGNLTKLGPNDPVPVFRGGYIDVKDVARTHLLAFEKEETKGKRLFNSAARCDSQDVLDIINDKFPELRGKIPVGNPGAGKAISDSFRKVDYSETTRLLGFKFQPLEVPIVEAVEQMLRVRKERLSL